MWFVTLAGPFSWLVLFAVVWASSKIEYQWIRTDALIYGIAICLVIHIAGLAFTAITAIKRYAKHLAIERPVIAGMCYYALASVAILIFNSHRYMRQ